MANIVSITIKPVEAESKPPGRFSRLAVEEAELQKDLGIVGDAKSGSVRQLNVMFTDEVELMSRLGFKTEPGELGEQIVIDGIERSQVERNRQLRLGPHVVIQIIGDRAPCSRLAEIHGQPKETAIGRIGFMAWVVEPGKIAVGSEVSLLPVPS